MTEELGPRRGRVPDPDQVIEHLLADLRERYPEMHELDEAGYRYLDAIGTLGDPAMTQDDLIEVAIRLAWRLVVAEEAIEELRSKQE